MMLGSVVHGYYDDIPESIKNYQESIKSGLLKADAITLLLILQCTDNIYKNSDLSDFDVADTVIRYFVAHGCDINQEFSQDEYRKTIYEYGKILDVDHDVQYFGSNNHEKNTILCHVLECDFFDTDIDESIIVELLLYHYGATCNTNTEMFRKILVNTLYDNLKTKTEQAENFEEREKLLKTIHNILGKDRFHE